MDFFLDAALPSWMTRLNARQSGNELELELVPGLSFGFGKSHVKESGCVSNFPLHEAIAPPSQ